MPKPLMLRRGDSDNMFPCRLLMKKFPTRLTTTASHRTIFVPRQTLHTSHRQLSIMSNNRAHGDLNNTEVMRETNFLVPDPAYDGKSLAIKEQDDNTGIRTRYRPFITSPEVTSSDWIAKSELSTALKISEADMEATGGNRVKILVLYGSLRER